jgi:hypothetical protein
MPVPDPSSFSFQSKQVAEYCWIQEFEGRQLSIKTRVFFTPFEFDPVTMNATGKYNTSVFIGGDWQPFIQRDYEPLEPELRALVSAQMSTWKAIGVI